MPLNNSFGLGFIFSADDRASAVMNKVNRNFQKFDKSTEAAQRRIQAAQGTITVGLATMATGALAVQQIMGAALNAGVFEQQAARVGAVAQASAETLDKLREKAIAAGLATQFSPTEAIKGLGELTVRGLTATEAIGALDAALDLAAGGMISIEAASSTTVSAMKIFGIEADGAALAADKLLKISNLTALAAGDLELALGTVARGAGATKQSLDEMLISIGLIKNTGVDVSVAGSSISAALLFAAKSADKFTKIGVAITDVSGEFRPFLEIVKDTQQALGGITNAAERAAKAQELFGRFGLTAFNAIGTQLANGIKTTTGETLKGAAAMAHFRNTLASAAGVAESFRKKILNTLPGQLTLLKGTLETFGVVFGMSIAEGIKPIIKVIRETLGNLIKFFQSLPAPLRKVIAIGSLVGAMFVFLGGAALVLVGTFVLALPIIQATLAAFVGFLPVIGAVALAALALAGVMFTLKRAFDQNLGGFGDTIRSVFGKVKLFFEALFQFMDQGFFSGPIAKKLSSPENAPVMKFLITMIRFGFRVKKFFQGVGEGFDAFLSDNASAFTAFGDAIKSIGAALGITGDMADGALGPSSSFAKFGTLVGKGLAAFFVGLIRIITVVIRVATGLWKGMMVGIKLMSPFFALISDAFLGIVDSLMEILEAFGVVSKAGDGFGDTWETVGKIIGFVRTVALMPLLAALALVAQVFKFVAKFVAVSVKVWIKAFGNVWDFLKGLFAFVTGDFSEGWEMMSAAVSAQLDNVVGFFSGMVGAVKDQFGTFATFLGNVATRMASAISDRFMALVESLGFVGQGFKFVGTIISLAVKFWVTAIGNAWDFIKGFFTFITGDFVGGWAMMTASIKSQLGNVVDSFASMLGAIKDQFSSFLDFIGSAAAKIPAQLRPAALDAFVANRQLGQFERSAGSAARFRDARTSQEAREFSLTQLNASASRSVVPFSNQTTGAVEAGSGAKGGMTVDDFKTGMTEVFEDLARNKTRDPSTQTINLVVDGARIGSAQAAARQRDAALSFAGDFFGD